MKTTMVRYRTTAAHAERNEALVHAVYDALRTLRPDGLTYATYRLADGVTFIHLATHEGPGDNPVLALPAFAVFQAELKDRCVDPPAFTELSRIDGYRAAR